MTGEPENHSCPNCGGRLHAGVATIPFILSEEKVIVIKGVPSEICGDCREPFMNGKVADDIMALLKLSFLPPPKPREKPA
ncbi:YgiT-type zinc finger protein [Candidatus Entotheonella palauensis]|uniref:YgiT-type zinc finger protein n=1 Tax=Candidatus Entotheonella palauensis TaxID=93172 RepID=UPI000B7F0308|nr:YgiT-type zinc finger protein [Candidatus Entotheonella palauensis]